jgi:hypothetical protein
LSIVILNEDKLIREFTHDKVTWTGEKPRRLRKVRDFTWYKKFSLSGRNCCHYNVQNKKISILPHFNAVCLTSCFCIASLYSWVMPRRVP